MGSRPDTPRWNKDRLEPESVREELVLAYFFVGIMGLRALGLGITNASMNIEQDDSDKFPS